MLPLMLIFAAGCGPAATSIGILPDFEADNSDGDTGIEGAPGVDDTADSANDTGDAGPSDEEAQAALFTESTIHEIEITLSEDAENGLWRDPYEFVSAAITINGNVIEQVGIRLRGKVGSFRTLSGKPKFKIDFREFVDNQDFHGLKSLSLNNAVVDCSYLKESVGYRVFREAGIPAGRTGFSHVTVNGQDYGLYVLVEVPDSQFLESRFPDDDEGNLYDGKYIYNPNNGSYTMVDFATGVDELFQLEEGTDVGHADITSISETLGSIRGVGAYDALADRVDWAEITANWAAEQWVGHVDGYAMNRNNYRVYFRPSDGKMVIIPWDFDYAFIEDYEWGMNWKNPTGKLAAACWRDESCAQAHNSAVATLTGNGAGRIDSDALLIWYDEAVDLIGRAAADDPRRECDSRSVGSEQSKVRDWIERRSDFMRDYWEL